VCSAINAKQAKEINNFQKTKLKLLKAKAAIWFNKECRKKQIIKQGIWLEFMCD
jgi:hypothetical protein